MLSGQHDITVQALLKDRNEGNTVLRMERLPLHCLKKVKLKPKQGKTQGRHNHCEDSALKQVVHQGNVLPKTHQTSIQTKLQFYAIKLLPIHLSTPHAYQKNHLEEIIASNPLVF